MPASVRHFRDSRCLVSPSWSSHFRHQASVSNLWAATEPNRFANLAVAFLGAGGNATKVVGKRLISAPLNFRPSGQGRGTPGADEMEQLFGLAVPQLGGLHVRFPPDHVVRAFQVLPHISLERKPEGLQS